MIRFGRFTLDISSMELRREGQPVEVQPLVLLLLNFLLERRGQLVTKDELAQALWKSSDVSDEVLARAVMKARRALGEDATAPVHLHTVLGKGYRLHAPDAAEIDTETRTTPKPEAAASPGAWRVLRFVNRSEGPELDWTKTGLQRLLCHLMAGSSQGLPVVPDMRSEQVAADNGPPASRAVRALAVFPGERIVAGEINPTVTGFELTLAWASAGQPTQLVRAEGRGLPALVMQTAEKLAPAAPWQRELAREHPRTWHRLYDLIAQMHRLPHAEAVQRLMHCLDGIAAHPKLLLRRAELLYSLSATDEAAADATRVEQMLAVADPPDLETRLAALVLLAQAAARDGNLALLRERVEHVSAFAASHPALAHCHLLMAHLNGVSGYLWNSLGDRSQAADCYERAILHAVRSGLADLELRYRVESMNDAILPRNPERAEATVRQLIDRAIAVGDFERASLAMLAFHGTSADRSRCAEAVLWSEKALALALPEPGPAEAWINARSFLMTDLLANGELDRAEQAIRRQQRETLTGSVHMMNLLEAQAMLHWRRGRLTEALQHYEAFLQDSRFNAYRVSAGGVCSHVAMLLSLLGRNDEAAQALEQLPEQTPLPVASRARAAVALARGRREDAKKILRAALPDARAGRQRGSELMVDLAWLDLEDGNDFEAEDLLDRILALQVDGAVTRWVELALRDRRQAVDPAEWETLRSQCPALVRYCPALGTPDDVQARRAGRAKPLPNLLSLLAC